MVKPSTVQILDLKQNKMLYSKAIHSSLQSSKDDDLVLPNMKKFDNPYVMEDDKWLNSKQGFAGIWGV